MVVNSDTELRVHQLAHDVVGLVRKGKRSPDGVARVLQMINDDVGWEAALFPPEGVQAVAGAVSLEAQVSAWEKLYREFDIELDRSSIQFPMLPAGRADRGGFNRLIIVHESLVGHSNRIVEILRTRMKVWTYVDDLDKEVVQAGYIKRPKGTYAVWVRENQEADKDLKNKSAQDLEEQAVNCLTLEERLLYELVYFMETGKHLDIKNWTLCAGSRGRDGGVPGVSWGADDGRLYVGWYALRGRDGNLRARAAVS